MKKAWHVHGMRLKKYDIECCDEYARECEPLSETLGGDYCLVQDIVDELNRWIDCTNTLPEQKLENFKEWIERG